jgi:hypothetical protein
MVSRNAATMPTAASTPSVRSELTGLMRLVRKPIAVAAVSSRRAMPTVAKVRLMPRVGSAAAPVSAR